MTLKTKHDFRMMLKIGRIVALARDKMKTDIRPGMTTRELDAIGGRVLARYGAIPAPRAVYDFPGINCLSVNDAAVHGVPNDRRLRPGDVVTIDVTASLDGYFADSAVTVVLPPVSPPKKRLIATAERAFWQALRVARPGQPIAAIGRRVERIVESAGFTVLRELNGHGIGRTIHEAPELIPNYFEPSLTGRFRSGMVVAIEPIITTGTHWATIDHDGWTVRTDNGSLAAHYEHTVVITKNRPVILTASLS